MKFTQNIVRFAGYAYQRLASGQQNPLHLQGSSDRTFVLVHGFAGEHSDLYDMGVELHRRTGHTVLAVDLSVDRAAVLMDIHNTAEIIAYRLAQIVTGSVVFVAHSFGGLVSIEVTRIWSQYPHLFPGVSCGGVCTIGTPQPGSLRLSNAACLTALSSLFTMFPPLVAMWDRQRMQLLWDHAVQADYPLVVIEGGNDEIVSPSPTPCYQHYTLLPTGTHVSLLLRDYELSAVCDAIEKVVQ